MLIERDGLKGVTSNPSIFEKAIGESDEYADALQAVPRHRATTAVADIYEHLAIADIRAAADVLRPVYERTQGRDGYVSLECSPYLANDTEATVAEALRLWEAVARPNLMVKVPATPAGHSRDSPADRPRAEHQHHVAVFRRRLCGRWSKPISPASRIWPRSGRDDRRDRQRRQLVRQPHRHGGRQAARIAFADRQMAGRLRGKVAIANAKLAYVRYKACSPARAGRPGGIRGKDAAAALGVHQHQESGLPGTLSMSRR